MSGELQTVFSTGKTIYFHVRNGSAQIWNTSGGGAFESYTTSVISSYKIAGVEQGTASRFYAGNFPSAIPPGAYSIVAKQQVGASPAETDPDIATGSLQWNGSTLTPLSDLATSGQVGQFAPIRMARGQMIQNFPVYFKSSQDHITPLVSGSCSGQIIRDNGSWGPLQSGNFTEVGNGFYRVNLTSGDLNANSVSLLFTANGISGGQADPVPMGIILQRVSGY